MTHANHDCQFLFTKDHAISIIYYIMKYITKPEAALHTKLTVAAAVRDAMQNLSADYMSNVNITKTFLIKTYNKLDTQREVGVPEAISHLLNIPDHYTEAIFERLHTSHLLQYIKRFGLDEQSEPSCVNMTKMRYWIHNLLSATKTMLPFLTLMIMHVEALI